MDAKSLARFTAKYVKEDWGYTSDCWVWTASRCSKGYGTFRYAGMVRVAHRVSYTYYEGEIPVGLTLDHLCRTRACVNPLHLEPMTNRENILRGYNPCAMHARKTHCKHGHPLTEENTYASQRVLGERVCKTCHRINGQKYHDKVRAARDIVVAAEQDNSRAAANVSLLVEVE